MSFDLGWGTEVFEAFIEPDIVSMSQGKHEKVVKPAMNGHAVKFFNMGPQPVQLFW